MPNDEYNTYRYDSIDGFERERRVEFLSSTLAEVQNTDWINSEGILSEAIEVTQMEIANGLTVSYNYAGKLKYTFDSEETKGKLKEISRLDIDDDGSTVFDKLFTDYGTLNTTPGPYYGKTKAIRVWSGADHWLLPKKSALDSLYLLPMSFANITVANRNESVVIGSNVPKILIYWPKNGYGSIVDAINDGTIYTRRNAFLYLYKGTITLS